VYNKIDRLELAPHVERDAEGQVASVWISAVKHRGLALLLEAIAERLALFARVRRIRAAASQAGQLRARLYSAGAIRAEQVAEDGSIEWSAAIPDGEAAALARLPGVTVEALAPLVLPSGEHTTCVADRGYLQSTPTARRS
jgi:GTP-binding protein HflX